MRFTFATQDREKLANQNDRTRMPWRAGDVTLDREPRGMTRLIMGVLIIIGIVVTLHVVQLVNYKL